MSLGVKARVLTVPSKALSEHAASALCAAPPQADRSLTRPTPTPGPLYVPFPFPLPFSFLRNPCSLCPLFWFLLSCLLVRPSNHLPSLTPHLMWQPSVALWPCSPASCLLNILFTCSLAAFLLPLDCMFLEGRDFWVLCVLWLLLDSRCLLSG